MSQSAKVKSVERRCPTCGLELAEDIVPEFCPRCLIQAGLETQPATGPDGTLALPGVAVKPTKGLPQPGERFGHYQIVRLLGQGGMGVVYEAEDLESGRRVALKVLSQALDSPEARKRFLREGQLAASISHPNSVYVFGTEEIGGTPVIAMELMAGGTLRDRVVAGGLMPPGDAVDAVLQIIAGLEAAQQTGILHRDVKPSNCFLDSDGTVKIGDFGLSISTTVRLESNLTETGALFGTPAFSSPEQLRGDELTVRSDIYAVGVTLYYLLTGRMPFEGASVVQLLATILEREPESPCKSRSEIPNALGRAVLRCLEKDSSRRFGSYAKLRAALRPYASVAAAPARLGRRFLAGCGDVPLALTVSFKLAALLPIAPLASTGAFYAIMALWFALPEALWGASAGKAILGLRVISPGRNQPGWGRVFLRAAVFLAAVSVVDLSAAFVFSEEVTNRPESGLLATAILFGMIGLVFTTARRRNGFASVHDLASRTRVVVKAGYSTRPRIAQTAEAVAGKDAAHPLRSAPTEPPRFGPYHFLGNFGESGDREILLAYDPRLLRKVWIRRLPIGAPPVPPEFCNISRPGRLRWLNGRRSQTESWDAYEASAGQSLLELISEKQSWQAVRFWLLDLAEELQVAAQDASTPKELALDRIWITSDGRAKLLDFPAPLDEGRLCKALSHPRQSFVPSHQLFLYQIAVSALQGRAIPIEEARQERLALPIALHARAVLNLLKTEAALPEIVSRLKLLISKVAVVSRAQRLALLAAGLWLPVVLTLSVALIRSDTEPAKPAKGFVPGHSEALMSSLLLGWSYAVGVVVIPCWLAAVLFRGGAFLRGLGMVVVTREGKPASRGRVLWRNFAAWLPLVLLPLPVAVLKATTGIDWPMFTFGALVLLAGLTAISLLLPNRSLPDRLAGTWLVPR